MAFDATRMQAIADDSGTWAAAQKAGGDGFLTRPANDASIGEAPVISRKAEIPTLGAK